MRESEHRGQGRAEAVICTRLDGARGSWAGTSGDLPEVGVSLLLHQKHFASTMKRPSRRWGSLCRAMLPACFFVGVEVNGAVMK